MPAARRTVLLHIWLPVPDKTVTVSLRDDGLGLLSGSVECSQLPLHWGMCLATYPFFRDVAETTGWLLTLQGRAVLSQIVRRVTESWGSRSTVVRATQRVVRSFVAWGVLGETRERGIFVPAPKTVVADSEVGPWLLEAGMVNSAYREHPLSGVAGAAFFFPFDLRLAARDIRRRPRLELHHRGAEGVVVASSESEPLIPHR